LMGKTRELSDFLRTRFEIIGELVGF